jgi:hypothetical protein
MPMPIQSSDVLSWIKSNQLILGLLLSAIVITMPEKLPHWREFPEWLWEWTRDASKTFMNFRHSGVPVSDVTHLQHEALTLEVQKDVGVQKVESEEALEVKKVESKKAIQKVAQLLNE